MEHGRWYENLHQHLWHMHDDHSCSPSSCVLQVALGRQELPLLWRCCRLHRLIWPLQGQLNGKLYERYDACLPGLCTFCRSDSKRCFPQYNRYNDSLRVTFDYLQTTDTPIHTLHEQNHVSHMLQLLVPLPINRVRLRDPNLQENQHESNRANITPRKHRRRTHREDRWSRPRESALCQ